MDSSKPSNPSGKSGEADDLIEEMARMMAAGAKDKSAGSPRQATARSAPSSNPGNSGQGAFASSGQNATTSTLTRPSAPGGQSSAGAPSTPVGSGKRGPDPATPTPSTPTSAAQNPATARPINPAFSLGGNPAQRPPAPSSPVPGPTAAANPAPTPAPAPTPTPAPTRASRSEPPAAAPAGSAFKFELGGNGAGASKTPPFAPTQKTPDQSTPPLGGRNAQSHNTRPGLTPEPAQNPVSEPVQSAPIQNTPAPAAFSAAARAEPLNDPIADLIRSQSQPDPAPSPAPAPAAAPDQPAAPDRFNVPPVFGLEGKPSEPLPSTPRQTPSMRAATARPDALDEIENLIGHAVHVDYSKDGSPQDTAPQIGSPREASPQGSSPQGSSPQDFSAQNAVEKPPGTPPQFIQTPGNQPHSAGIATPPPANNTGVDAAEAAILQAMGTGAALPKDATGPDQQPEPAVQPDPEALLAGSHYAAQKPARARFIIPAIAVLLLAGAAGGGYYLLTSGAPQGDAPVLLADGSPSKEAPVLQAPSNGDQSVIFDGLEGNSVPEADQALLSRDQTEGATGNEVRQVITADTTAEGLANRRVRTVTVRPDGTIINGDDAVAGGELLPVAQPTLPDLPAGAVNTQLADTIVAALPQSPDLTTNTALPLSAANLSATATTFTVDGAAVPFPRSRLSDLERQNRVAVNSVAQTRAPTAQPPVSLGNDNTSGAVDLIAALANESVPTPPATVPVTTTASTPTPAVQAPPLQPVANPTSFVQLASLRRQDVADETAASLQTRYASALRGGQLQVSRVDLGDRGVFYRVLLPTASLSEASSVCNAIQNAGGDCFPRNN